MNCIRARFLIYAYFDRELSATEGEALSQHLTACPSCSARAASARGLAQLLHSRVDRRPAPPRLLARLHNGSAGTSYGNRLPTLIAAAVALIVLLLPLSSDVTSKPGHLAASMVPVARRSDAPLLVSRRLTGTFVCLECEARSEAGLCPVSHEKHHTGFCAENGELWRVMSPSRNAEAVQAALGRTATVEGIAFPESGFMRVSRVGY